MVLLYLQSIECLHIPWKVFSDGFVAMLLCEVQVLLVK